MNAAERFIEAVWEQHCPDKPEPPIFVANQLEPDLGIQVYGFETADRYKVGRPRWGPHLSTDELAELVGGPIDPGRGEGMVPWVYPPEGRLVFRVVTVVGLPRADHEGDPPCMPAPTPWWRRVGRQVVPRRVRPECCSYHLGDWRRAAAAAVAALRHAQAIHAPEDGIQEVRRTAYRHLDAQPDLDATTRRWASSLFTDPVQPHYDVGGYTNGRHRSQAMLDAGARRTVVGIWEPPQGRPW
ncbi:hypothetical protein AB0I28_32455 [Phytomonospora sp. NPDC050363]|uniref:hypothetical protein n=1 Tax=Phytomonospora sp. NPDC050363 TaxID=3155642 RepID=UPI0033E2E3FB